MVVLRHSGVPIPHRSPGKEQTRRLSSRITANLPKPQATHLTWTGYDNRPGAPPHAGDKDAGGPGQRSVNFGCKGGRTVSVAHSLLLL